jgi:hypothetical protein
MMEVFSWLVEHVPESVWALILIVTVWHIALLYSKIKKVPCDAHAERIAAIEKERLESERELAKYLSELEKYRLERERSSSERIAAIEGHIGIRNNLQPV